MLNNKGISLVESLLVLSIVVFISALIISFTSYDIDDHQVLDCLKYSLYQTKLNSIIYKEKTYMEFDHDQMIIESDHYNQIIDFRNTIFDHKTFSYNINGHINKGGHVDFEVNGKHYVLKFHLGSGYFEIE